ncbi:hypothetical protein SNEBB_000304 [Seison nebaliae]|nr:hypothetical protein SNEBB_000304 [Seison nebaliae]
MKMIIRIVLLIFHINNSFTRQFKSINLDDNSIYNYIPDYQYLQPEEDDPNTNLQLDRQNDDMLRLNDNKNENYEMRKLSSDKQRCTVVQATILDCSNLQLSSIRMTEFSTDKTQVLPQQVYYNGNKLKEDFFFGLKEFDVRGISVLFGQTSELYLDYNQISYLNRSFTENVACVHLHHLSMSNNRLTKIDDGTFDRFKSLYHLDLSSNLLEEFRVNLPNNLEYLDLSDNRLLKFPMVKLPKTLFHFNISSNSLERLDENDWKNLNGSGLMSSICRKPKKLKRNEKKCVLDFNRNLWKCDCHGRIIVYLLKQFQEISSIVSTAICDYPHPLKYGGHTMVSLDPIKTLTCPIQFQRRKHIQFSIGEKKSLSLSCNVYGDPPPKIIWLQNGEPIVKTYMEERDEITVRETYVNEQKTNKTSILHIGRIHTESAGNYTCMAGFDFEQESQYQKIFYLVNVESTPSTVILKQLAAAGLSKNVIIVISCIILLLLIFLIMFICIRKFFSHLTIFGCYAKKMEKKKTKKSNRQYSQSKHDEIEHTNKGLLAIGDPDNLQLIGNDSNGLMFPPPPPSSDLNGADSGNGTEFTTSDGSESNAAIPGNILNNNIINNGSAYYGDNVDNVIPTQIYISPVPCSSTPETLIPVISNTNHSQCLQYGNGQCNCQTMLHPQHLQQAQQQQQQQQQLCNDQMMMLSQSGTLSHSRSLQQNQIIDQAGIAHPVHPTQTLNHSTYHLPSNYYTMQQRYPNQFVNLQQNPHSLLDEDVTEDVTAYQDIRYGEYKKKSNKNDDRESSINDNNNNIHSESSTNQDYEYLHQQHQKYPKSMHVDTGSSSLGEGNTSTQISSCTKSSQLNDEGTSSSSITTTTNNSPQYKSRHIDDVDDNGDVMEDETTPITSSVTAYSEETSSATSPSSSFSPTYNHPMSYISNQPLLSASSTTTSALSQPFIDVPQRRSRQSALSKKFQKKHEKKPQETDI